MTVNKNYAKLPSYEYHDTSVPSIRPKIGTIKQKVSILALVLLFVFPNLHNVQRVAWAALGRPEAGNAADAAVASVLCVGVVSMYHSGIGRGGFAVIRSPGGSYEAIDFREVAPLSAYQDMFKGRPQDSIRSGLASGVPGEIRGLEYIHKRYGSLPWKELVDPAARVARDGFVVGEDLERCIDTTIAQNPSNYDFLTPEPSWAEDFAPEGRRVMKGDVMFRKRYADTLEKIGSSGPDAFYEGPIAESIVQTTRENNGNITLHDLQSYSVPQLNISAIKYRRYRIYSTTAPSSGAVALSALKILERYENMYAPGTINVSTHRLVEAMKFAYGQRLRLGDPSFVPGMQAYQEEMLSDAVARRIHSTISDDYTLDLEDYDTDKYTHSPSNVTAHLVAAHWTGLSISLTTTVNLLFGSQIIDPRTGIIMNDVMNDFSIPGVSDEYGYTPSPSNFIQPGKRPMSSTTPVLVEDENGNLLLALRAAGGSRIISSTIQNLVHTLDQNMSIADALAQPRLHDQLLPNEVGFESDFDQGVMAFPRARRHNIRWMPSTMSACQGIFRHPYGTFEAAGEPRQKNSAGYSV